MRCEFYQIDCVSWGQSWYLGLLVRDEKVNSHLFHLLFFLFFLGVNSLLSLVVFTSVSCFQLKAECFSTPARTTEGREESTTCGGWTGEASRLGAGPGHCRWACQPTCSCFPRTCWASETQPRRRWPSDRPVAVPLFSAQPPPERRGEAQLALLLEGPAEALLGACRP